MSNISSKVELLYMINDLKEAGDIKNAMKLQKIFIDSISDDKKSGRYNLEVQLDRKEKKVVMGLKDTLTSYSN